MKPIVVIGSINMDLVSRADRIPQAGETILGSGFQMYSGGKGANQAVAVARLGYPAILLGVLGNDVFGQQLLSTLGNYGVETKHIGIADRFSGTASIVVDSRGENAIVVNAGANLEVTPEFLNGKLDVLRGAGMVLTQLEIPLETVVWLAEFCAEFGIPLMLDPAPAMALPPELLANVTWFTPNQAEAAFYAGGEDSAEAMLAGFFRLGIRNVVLKKGWEGAVLASAEGARDRIEAFQVPVMDTTAAGDAFNGAFGVALVRGETPADAGRIAAAAAALSVMRHGAQGSLASQEEVEAFLMRQR